jgi:hypothetical protein
MADIELQRSKHDRRLYGLDGVGTLRVEGVFSRRATAEARGRTWHIARRGLWQRGLQASNPDGTVAGEFLPRGLRRGGALHWGGRELGLRPASSWRERYAIVDGERELAILDGKGWGKRPVNVTIDDPGAIEPGLLLFAVFVVRGLAEDAGSATSTATMSAA